MAKKKKEAKKESKETTKKTESLDNIIPDSKKTIKNLEINASFVTSLQQVLVLVMATATEATQITDAYKKMNELDEAIASESKEGYTGDPWTNFDSCLYTMIKLTTYLRSEVIRQKAYVKFTGQIDKDQYGDQLKSLLSAAPENIDEEMHKLASKMSDALNVNESTED